MHRTKPLVNAITKQKRDLRTRRERADTIKQLLSCHKVEEALNVYNQHPDPFIASSLIGYFWKQKANLTQAFSVYNTLLKTSAPDSFVVTSLVRGCDKLGQPHKVTELWQAVMHYRINIDNQLTTAFLCACIEAKDFSTAKQIINKIQHSKLQPDLFLQTILIKYYTAVGQGEKAVELWKYITKKDIPHDDPLLVAILGACAQLHGINFGKELHQLIDSRGILELPTRNGGIVSCALINMYAKCGSLSDAEKVFNSTTNKDVILWTNMMAVYNSFNLPEATHQLFKKMILQKQTEPNAITFSCLLAACFDIKMGQFYHNLLVSKYSNFLVIESVQIALVAMYMRCTNNFSVDSLPNEVTNTAVSWNFMISEYHQTGHHEKALALFVDMENRGITPTDRTFSSLFASCSKLQDPNLAKNLYHKFNAYKIASTDYTTSSAIVMFAKCGNLLEAERIFNNANKTPAIVNALLNAYQHVKEFNKAFQIFDSLDCAPTETTFATIFSICSACLDYTRACKYYAKFESQKMNHNEFTASAAISMFAKNNSLETAETIFSQCSQLGVSVWNAILQAYLHAMQYQKALATFSKLQDSAHIPDGVTFTTMFSVVGYIRDAKWAQLLYNLFLSSKIPHTEFTASSAITMFVNCDMMSFATDIFNAIFSKGTCTLSVYNSILSAYASKNELMEAIAIYETMIKQRVIPNVHTYSSLLAVIGDSTNLVLGKKIHEEINYYYGAEHIPMYIANALISMYSKCGKLDKAQEIFDQLVITTSAKKKFGQLSVEDQNELVVSWTAMIQAYGHHGLGHKALGLFHEMQQRGVKPNEFTVACVLNACSHAGLVKEAHQIYSKMHSKYNINPSDRHHAIMVDCLGRAGQLDRAEHFIQSLKQPSVGVWKAMLGASHIHKDIQRANRAAAQIAILEPCDASSHVVLATTYAALGNFAASKNIWNIMKQNKIKKIPGITWVTINGQTETFYAGSDSWNHPYKEQIIAFLLKSRELIYQLDYKPDLSCVLQPELSGSDKLERLWLHSEKLALAYAMLVSDPKMDIIMHKNLRVCKDCHTALKLLSLAHKRRFIIRDANRFHHFENGACSCLDYW